MPPRRPAGGRPAGVRAQRLRTRPGTAAAAAGHATAARSEESRTAPHAASARAQQSCVRTSGKTHAAAVTPGHARKIHTPEARAALKARGGLEGAR